VSDDRPGFWARFSTRTPGAWCIEAPGWYIDGFASRRQALDWVLGYLSTVSENNARLGLEEAERKRESDARIAVMMATILEPPPPLKGKEN
jgi:hypothetical protein